MKNSSIQEIPVAKLPRRTLTRNVKDSFNSSAYDFKNLNSNEKLHHLKGKLIVDPKI